LPRQIRLQVTNLFLTINSKVNTTKYMLIVGDGMADYPVPELSNKTPLQAAHKPGIDAIAAKGRSGLIKNVPDGMSPGSDVAILSLLGYDPRIYLTGRGPLEAAARGITLGNNDAAVRMNLITEENGILKDYSAGHITTKEATALVQALKEKCEIPGSVEFFPGLDYRHFLILRNFPDCNLVEFTPPHDVVGSKVSAVLPKAKAKKVEKKVAEINQLILGSPKVLESHPVNVKRAKQGENMGNMIWPWSGGKKPSLPQFKEKFGLSAAVISAVDLVKGIGVLAGMEVIKVSGATGNENTNYEGKADAALEALKTNDLVFVHVEAPDEAGHVKDFNLKVKTIEDLDRRLVERIVKGLNEPCTVAVLPDHPTPIKLGTHSMDPVPFTIMAPNQKPDRVEKFDEESAKKGAYGVVTEQSFMDLFIASKQMKPS
jgi:2,3-bisphosphoglycerate-independent phosphoglycerate mutase